MYSKQSSKEANETRSSLDSYIKTLKRAQEHLPDNLVTELDKVLFDVIRVKNETSNFKTYYFAKGFGDKLDFNFKMLEDYVLNFEKPIQVPDLKDFKYK